MDSHIYSFLFFSLHMGSLLAFLREMEAERSGFQSSWKDRASIDRASLALANKTARIAWNLMISEKNDIFSRSDQCLISASSEIGAKFCRSFEESLTSLPRSRTHCRELPIRRSWKEEYVSTDSYQSILEGM